MPYYEVTLTASKPVLVEAENEQEAEERAIDSCDWNRVEAFVEDEFDSSDPKQLKWIDEYMQQGDFIR